jgi:hypothetical protein
MYISICTSSHSERAVWQYGYLSGEHGMRWSQQSLERAAWHVLHSVM